MLHTILLILLSAIALYFLIRKKDFRLFFRAVLITLLFLLIWEGIAYIADHELAMNYKFYISLLAFNVILLNLHKKSDSKE